MKRIFDLFLAFFLLIVLLIPMVIISLIILMTSNGPVLHWSNRIGKNNIIFQMPKFRTMKIDAPVVATHLMKNPNDYITAPGGFIRRTSLDEFPQLFSILKGNMSFVGPRPALFNQEELIILRNKKMCPKCVLLYGLRSVAQSREVRASLKSLLGRMDAVAFSSSGRK